MRMQLSEAAILRREANNRRRLAAGTKDDQARETLERVAANLDEKASEIETAIAETAAAKAREASDAQGRDG
jgi:hypothetical protein